MLIIERCVRSDQNSKQVRGQKRLDIYFDTWVRIILTSKNFSGCKLQDTVSEIFFLFIFASRQSQRHTRANRILFASIQFVKNQKKKEIKKKIYIDFEKRKANESSLR
ncbi:hypothetical protein PUN28_007418 [Cardiocondyla obscurior]|uniref:Uncharacterized protein n=1 Tax=Cardiocondyla obscurior TaxID=286306 RepID=A0AAW2G5H1_9HYME